MTIEGLPSGKLMRGKQGSNQLDAEDLVDQSVTGRSTILPFQSRLHSQESQGTEDGAEEKNKLCRCSPGRNRAGRAIAEEKRKLTGFQTGQPTQVQRVRRQAGRQGAEAHAGFASVAP